MTKEEMLNIACSESSILREIKFIEAELLTLWDYYDLENDGYLQQVYLDDIHYYEDRLSELRGKVSHHV